MIKFSFIILIELIFSPFLFAWNEVKKHTSIKSNRNVNTQDKVIPLNNEIIYAIHEWSGYPTVRSKTIKYVNKTFNCGLRYHLQRIRSYKGAYKIRPILTISDYSPNYLDSIRVTDGLTNEIEVYSVTNSAMDFSGYSYVCRNLLDLDKEQIIILSNSSVNDDVEPFIDDYVNILKRSPTIGMIGTSYSSTISQTFIKNNFNLHLQSFFLVTKTSVLKKIMDINNEFPGENETFKLSIIRFGEVKLTKLVQKLGYDVAFIDENGKVVFFPKVSFWSNGYHNWKLPKGDYRLFNKSPNKINVVK